MLYNKKDSVTGEFNYLPVRNGFLGQNATMWFTYNVVLCIGLIQFIEAGNGTVRLIPANIDLQSGYSTAVSLCLSQTLTETATLSFTYDTGQGIFLSDNRRVINPLPNITLEKGASGCTDLNITGVTPGHVYLGVNTTSEQFTDLSTVFIRVTVVHSSVLVTIAAVIGWIYFAAWTVSGYPQAYLNWRRKSVVGVSLDFMSFNLTSFIAYSLFNSGLYWLKTVQEEYFAIHPRGINPVQLNDVIFALHALLLTVFLIIQCCIYDRGPQKISVTCYVIQGLIFLFSLVALFVAVAQKITWLTYLYYFSYVKLGITLIKYTPQVYIIYRRKTAEGFSMMAIACDFTGGLFSILQMFVLSYNSDDWGSILGDPTKFGLGLFSMMFDVIFLIQNFCLYKSPPSPNEESLLINKDGTDSYKSAASLLPKT